MSYLIILLLSLRPFICEQVSVTSGLLFNFIFCSFFLIYVFSRKNLEISPTLVFLSLIFPLLVYLSNLYSISSYNSQSALLRIFVFVYMFIFVYTLNEKERCFLLKIMVGVGLIIALRALYQYFFGLEYIKNNFSNEEITREGFYALEMLKHKRIVSWFTAPNLLASYLLMIIPVSCGLLFSSIEKKKKVAVVLFSGVLLLLIIVLLLSKSIGAYISFILGLVFLFMMKPKIIKPGPMLKSAVIIFLILCFSFFGMFLKRSDFFLNVNNPQNSVLQRAYYWQTAKKVIHKYPLMGVGAGNFGIIYPRYKNIKANETIYVHNSYLQLWAESGVFALIFLVGFTGLIFKSARREKFLLMNSAVTTGGLTFLIHNFVDYSFFIPQVSSTWWILLGCVLANQSRVDLKQTKIRRRSVSFMKWSFLCLGLLVLFNIYLELNSQKSLDKAIVNFKKKEYTASISEANKALDYKPNNDMAYYILAHNFRKIKPDEFLPQVQDNYLKAIDLNSQYAFYYYELGSYLQYFGFKKQARNFFFQAIKYYPQNPHFLKSIN